MFFGDSKKRALQLCCTKIPQKEIFVLVDVGAQGGIARKWGSIESYLKVVAFEPDSRSIVPATKTNEFISISAILSKERRDLRFYVTKGLGKSSLYRPNDAFLSQFVDSDRFSVIKEIIFPAEKVLTLDHAFELNHVQGADFIKLDTQGSELDILEGGKKILSSTFGAQIEVEFAPLYENQPLFHDVDSFMNNHGFQLMDLRRFYWKRKAHYEFIGKGQLVCADALYFRSLESFQNMFSNLSEGESTISKLYKCVLVCLIYGLYDYAIAIWDYARQRGHIAFDENQDLMKAIMKLKARDWISVCVPSVRIRDKLYRLAQKIKPMSYLGWADADIEIANVKDF